jgi:hypothetical protein
MTHQSGQLFVFSSNLIVGDGWPIKHTNQFNENESAPGFHPLAESGFVKQKLLALMDTSRSQSLHFFFYNIFGGKRRKMWR